MSLNSHTECDCMLLGISIYLLSDFWLHIVYSFEIFHVNTFVPNAPFLYPLTVFWCFQGVEKGCIGNKWVKYTLKKRDFICVTHFTPNFTPILAVAKWRSALNVMWIYLPKKVLSFSRIGLYYNSAYHKAIFFKIHSFFELDYFSREKQKAYCM